MYINITQNETGNNKGSSGQLVTYLEKENHVAEKLNEPEYWFNQERNNIQPYDVRYTIDNNIAKLSKDETKFFLINISPSEKEISYLKERYGEDGAKQHLKQYANQVMDDYALNFKRNNINGNKDLVYFGKLENHRYYTYKDEEVKNGHAKKGDQKPGEQMHVQIIVSRKDASNSIKLSPLNNSRGKNQAHSLKVGQFDRVAFKQATEKRFDKMFSYERELKETFKYANTLKHGDYEQRLEMKEKRQEEQITKQERQQSHQQRSIFDTLLGKGAEKDMPNIPEDRKRKKRPDQSQGLGM
ncbi:DUF5712 family protein [Mucilaginibacter sp. RB4R14]|uniref:DUF5712 family protein n=1 Tax=Mucilaginibacter aurantiaciroseus TaxID=2949308 RepID=UPI0020905A5B|nr:DUF5712 family protein [Mucilaginibacter aurantiaciroseus]MCO5936891.1 DUF5712 family protein [Mucilaginibacter aurantiaciroseus]